MERPVPPPMATSFGPQRRSRWWSRRSTARMSPLLLKPACNQRGTREARVPFLCPLLCMRLYPNRAQVHHMHADGIDTALVVIAMDMLDDAAGREHTALIQQQQAQDVALGGREPDARVVPAQDDVCPRIKDCIGDGIDALIAWVPLGVGLGTAQQRLDATDLHGH